MGLTDETTRYMISTTLSDIRAHKPCETGWQRLLTYLNKTRADNDTLPLAKILDSNDLDDTIWVCSTLAGTQQREFYKLCAYLVERLRLYVFYEGPILTGVLVKCRDYLSQQGHPGSAGPLEKQLRRELLDRTRQIQEQRNHMEKLGADNDPDFAFLSAMEHLLKIVTGPSTQVLIYWNALHIVASLPRWAPDPEQETVEIKLLFHQWAQGIFLP